jgi:integrase
MSGYQRHPKYRELFKPSASAVWWAFLPRTGPGRMPRESTGQRDDVAAHRWYLERIRAPSPDRSALDTPAAKERTLRDALIGRVEWLKSARRHDDPTRKKLAADTIEFYEKKSRPLLHVLGGGTFLSAIGHEQIRRYIVTRSRTAAATTIGKELTTLSMAMKLARKDGVSCPVFEDIKPEDFAAVYVPRERWLSEAEVDALLAELAPKRAAVVAFIVATSATYPSEVAPVRPKDVDVKRGVVHLPGKKRATRDRKLKIPSYARKYLELAAKWLGPDGFEPWTNVNGDLKDATDRLSMCEPCRAIRKAWGAREEGCEKPSKKACRACKATPAFPRLSPNDLRRTFVQWLVRSGVPYELVYPMTGHNSPRMLERVYGKRDATAVADLVELALKKAPKAARKRAAG